MTARTFGSKDAFDLSSADVSLTGLNLRQEHKTPFRANTLLEITIHPDGLWLKSPIACTAKVVRCDGQGDPDRSFGVQITELSATDQTAWRKAIAEIDRSTSAPAIGAA